MATALWGNFSINPDGDNHCGAGSSYPIPYSCGQAPCSYEKNFQRYYCCELGTPTCQTFANQGACDGPNGNASSQQTLCDRLDTTWCCLKDQERCTQRGDNINLCQAEFENPFASVNATQWNALIYSPLASASPSVKTIQLDTASVFAELSPATTTLPSSSGTSPTSSSTDTPAPPSGGLSGGAIAGIVIGALALLAALIAGWFLWRRRKHNSANEMQSLMAAPEQPMKTDYDYYAKKSEFQSPPAAPSEVPGYVPQRPVELDAGR